MSVFIGIDVSKASLDVVSLPDNQHLQVANTADGHQQLLDWIDRFKPVTQIALEASGRYGELVAQILVEHHYAVSYLNPKQIHAFARMQLHYHKTDLQDAKLIARYCQLFQPELYQPTAALQRRLQQLSRRIDTLKKMRQQELNRLSSGIQDPFVRQQLQTHIELLERMIADTQQTVRDLIQSDDNLAQQAQLLTSIKGISDTTAQLILAEIDINNFASARQLAAYIGITPLHFQSGTSVNKHAAISKQGNSRLRAGLYMPSIVAMQHNLPCRKRAQSLRERHKPGKLIVIAIMRKLIHQIYGILKSRIPFDPHFENSA